MSRDRDAWKLGARRRRNAPANAASVFPTANPAAAMCGIGERRFAKKAPIAIPGQTRYPSRSREASAMPAAGQTGETLPVVKGTARPSRAATKYATETRTVWTRNFPTGTLRMLALLAESEVFKRIYDVRRTRGAKTNSIRR